MNQKLFEELWQRHSGKIVGCSAGFAVGILVITFGFFRTLFLICCIGAGYIVGKRIDEKEDIMDILDKLLPPGYHR